MSAKPPSQTTYLVQVFKSPHWTDVLSTKDKKLAKAELKKLGKAGRITEITPRNRV